MCFAKNTLKGCSNMCKKNYNIKKEKNKEFKYKHLNYTERTQIERWYNIEHKSCGEIAKLLSEKIFVEISINLLLRRLKLPKTVRNF